MIHILAGCVSCVPSARALGPALALLGAGGGACVALGPLLDALNPPLDVPAPGPGQPGPGPAGPGPGPQQIPGEIDPGYAPPPPGHEPDPNPGPPQEIPGPPPPPAPTPFDLLPGQGPDGVQITHVDGQPVITLPSGQQVHPTAIAPPAGAQPGPNGPNAWSALLPSGDQLTILPDGSTSLQLISTGGTQNWDAAGHFTGGSGPDANGASLPNPSISHDTVVPMDGGGYRVDHPDGSSDIHWPDGRVVHVLPDGAHWVEVPPVKG